MITVRYTFSEPLNRVFFLLIIEIGECINTQIVENNREDFLHYRV